MMKPTVLVNLEHILNFFDPRLGNYLGYQTSPGLAEVMSLIGIRRVIEYSFINSAYVGNQNISTEVGVYVYMEHHCHQALTMLEGDSLMIYEFDILIDNIIQHTDIALRHSFEAAGIPIDWGHYAFERWLDFRTGVFVYDPEDDS